MVTTINWANVSLVLALVLTAINLLEKFATKHPMNKLKARLEKAEELLERDNQHLKRHDSEISAMHEKVDSLDKVFADQNYIIIKCMSALLDNIINGGDNMEQVKKVSEELKEYLYKH